MVLRVIEFKVAAIKISGNEFFSEENLLRSLPELRTGTAPNTDQLGRSLSLANEHPAKRIDLTFSESPEESSVNAELKVKDQRVWSVFSSLDNTGTEDTGDYRVSIGAQHTNLFGRDHIVTVSYSTSPDQTEDVRQIGLNYQIPFYEQASTLTLTFSDSDVDSGELSGISDLLSAAPDACMRPAMCASSCAAAITTIASASLPTISCSRTTSISSAYQSVSMSAAPRRRSNTVACFSLRVLGSTFV